MRIVLATLCLNEIEWLPALYEQHRDWPGLVKWVFVEAADITYARSSPERVSPLGLSIDGTTEFLEGLARSDSRVVHIKHGLCSTPNKEQSKCQARQRYLTAIERLVPRPELIVVVDADEFYVHEHQRIVEDVVSNFPNHRAYLFPQRHIWFPPSLRESGADCFADMEVVGGYWSVPHFRVWRWSPGLRYQQNHNWIEDQTGRFLSRRPFRMDSLAHNAGRRAKRLGIDTPQCIHMGFASSAESRVAKHRYYVARGEGVSDHRSMYVECRAAYECWKPGDLLPHGASVIPYTGPVPEVFREHPNDEHRSTSPNKLLTASEHAGSNPSLAGANPEARSSSSG